jgi:hypothetical protein
MQVIDRPQAVEDLAAITVPAACLRMSAAEPHVKKRKHPTLS